MLAREKVLQSPPLKTSWKNNIPGEIRKQKSGSLRKRKLQSEELVSGMGMDSKIRFFD